VSTEPPPPADVDRGRASALLDEATQRSRATARQRLQALHDRAPAMAQAALAASGAWLVATEVIGHARPFFAPIAAIVVLGVTQGRHARRAVELALGVALGIAVADLIVQLLGPGALTIAVVVALAMAAAIALGGEALLISQAATSAVIVATLGTTAQSTLDRAIDSFTGSAIALIVGFLLLPIDPVRWTRSAAMAVLDDLASVLADVAAALERRDRDAVADALVRARSTEGLRTAFSDAAARGLEVARYSPLRRGGRPLLERYATAAPQIDLAVRDVRVLARGALRAVELGDNVPPDVIAAIRDLEAAARALAPALDDPRRAERAREHALRAAASATRSLQSTANLSTSAIVGQVRSTAVDLLRGLGEERDAAVAALRSAASLDA
jgi:uncharacterized membrane protein YgaE (UPF0421/DUF939 family)